jgi:hypothetical protein
VIATTTELLYALQGRGLVAAGATPAPAVESRERPWYIGLLLGAAGWLAGIFLVIFVFLLFKPNSEAAALAGVPLLLAAWGLFRIDRDGAFLPQLALALSIAGQVAVVITIFETLFKHPQSPAGPAFVAMLLQLALIPLMPNRLHRAMSTLFACAAWAVFLRYAMFDQPNHSFGFDATVPLLQALAAWAITWLPVGGILYSIVRNEEKWMAKGRQEVVRPVATGLIVGLAIATLLSSPLEAFQLFGSQRSSGWFALWPLLCAIAAMGGVVAAFALGKRGLAAVCIVAALADLSHFYYAMGASLLVKSVIMMALGATLLAVAHRLAGRRT